MFTLHNRSVLEKIRKMIKWAQVTQFQRNFGQSKTYKKYISRLSHQGTESPRKEPGLAARTAAKLVSHACHSFNKSRTHNSTSISL